MKSCQWPLRGDLDFSCRFFPNRRRWLAYIRKKTSQGVRCSGRGVAAKCFIYKIEVAPAQGNQFAEIVLYPDYAAAGDIAHESAHILVKLFADLGLDLRKEPHEEEFCLLLGEMTDAVTDWLKYAGRLSVRSLVVTSRYLDWVECPFLKTQIKGKC